MEVNDRRINAHDPPPSKKHRISGMDEVLKTKGNICVGARASEETHHSKKPKGDKHHHHHQGHQNHHHHYHHHHHHELNVEVGGRSKIKDQHSVEDREEQIEKNTPSSPAKSTISSVSSTSSDEDLSNLSEESFLTWLLEQKSEGVAATQMLDVLGLGVSDGASIDDDELWDAMLSMGIRLLQPRIPARQKLSHVNTIHDVVNLLRTSKKIIVLAGAGISVSCGIPDFRSENGIYSRLGEYNLPNPQCMFDIDFFRSNPRPFFAFAKELFPKSKGFTFIPSRSHYFLKLLQDKGKLLRIYSQNIDMLEHAAGISHEKSVLCHGSFATATCLSCKKVYPNDSIREDVAKQRVPMCTNCHSENGIIKPDIVFFGESLPRRFHDSIKNDEDEADLVLVMGSSLKVNPVRSIVGRIHKNTPMVLINREPVGRPHKFDVELLGFSDEIVQELCRLLEWEIPIPDVELLKQTNLDQDHEALIEKWSAPIEPLEYQFISPCSHLFNGAKAASPSSDEDEEGSENSSSPPTSNGAQSEEDEDEATTDTSETASIRNHTENALREEAMYHSQQQAQHQQREHFDTNLPPPPPYHHHHLHDNFLDDHEDDEDTVY